MKKFLAALMFMGVLLGSTISASAEYTVQKGDTFYKIAEKYNMGLYDLISLNPHITNPSMIKVGDFIIVRSAAKKQDIVDYAKSLQESTKYVWGGTDFIPPMNTDCSGVVQAVYGKFGLKLPRVSRDQAKTGTPVTFKDLQVGDLMFFSTRDDKTITHVGIYMGHNYWISNLNSKKSVQILNTWGKWTQAYFQWGTRYEL